MSAQPSNRTSSKLFARGSATAFTVYIGGAGLTFLLQLLLARGLGPESFGIYSYAFAWISLMAYCAALGFPVALVRFAAMYEARGEWGLLRGVVGYAERNVLIAGLVIAFGGIAGVLALHELPLSELYATFLPGFLIVPIWALLMLRSAVVRAFGGVMSALAPDRLIRDGLLLVMVAVWVYVFWADIDARLAMGLNAACMLAALGVSTWALYRMRPGEMMTATEEHEISRWWMSAIPLLVANAANTLFNKTGVLWLGWDEMITQAGIYGLVFNISFLVVLPRNAVDTLFAPAISRFHALQDVASLQALMLRAAVLSFSVSAVMAGVLGIGAEYLLHLFGPEFEAGVDALRILLLGQVLVAAAGSQVNILAMTGHEKASAIILIIATGFNVLVTAVFVAIWGLNGAAWAMTLSLVAWQIVMAQFIWKRLGLWPGVFGAMMPRSRGKTR